MIGSISKVRPCGHHHHYKYAHAEKYDDLYYVCNRNTEYRNDLEPDGELKFIFQNLKNWGGQNSCDSTEWKNITKIDNNFPNVTGRWSHALDNSFPTLKYLNLHCPYVTNAHAFLFMGVNGKIKELYLKFDNVTQINSFMPPNILQDDSQRKIKLYLPKCINFDKLFGNVSGNWTRVNLEHTNFELYAPNVTTAPDAFAGTKIHELSYQIDEDGNWTFLSNKEARGKKYTFFTKLQSGANLFYGCILTKDFSVQFLENLPTYTSGTHNLTMGIHVDHKFDPDVNVALKKCQNSYITPLEEIGLTLPEEVTSDKGWTLGVEWNGNATESEIIIDTSLEYSTVALPENYTRCLYLQSDGTQYIDTEYIPTDSTGIWNAAKLLGNSECNAVGCRTNSIYAFTPKWLTSSINSYYGWGAASNMNIKGNKGYHESSLNFLNDRKAILRVPSTNGNYSYDLGTLTTAPSHSLYIFARNYNGNPEQIWNGRIYRVKISEGDQVVRDFIPCLDDKGVPCMRDVINRVNYYKQGSNEDFSYEIYDGEIPVEENFANIREGGDYIPDASSWNSTAFTQLTEMGTKIVRVVNGEAFDE